MTDAEFRVLIPIIDWQIRGWQDMPDYDDLRQHALIKAWRSASAAHTCSPLTAARRGALCGAIDYLRSRQAARPLRRYANDWPAFVSLSPEPDDEDDPASPTRSTSQEPTIPDFTEALLDGWEAHELAGWALAQMTPHQARCVRAYTMAGRSQRTAAAVLGITESALEGAVLSGIRRARRALAARGTE